MLLNYHIGCIVLGLLCAGVRVRFGLGGIRAAGFSRQPGYHPILYSSTITMMHAPINIRFENHFISDVGISRVLLARDVCLQRDPLETSKNDRNLTFRVVAVIECLFN